jgi:hypothetical protein
MQLLQTRPGPATLGDMSTSDNAKVLPASADSLARLHTREAIGTLVDVMRDKEARSSDRIAAAKEVLDRGHGKATQAIISIPARHAVAARLAAMSDEALLAIAANGRPIGGQYPNQEPEQAESVDSDGDEGSAADLVGSNPDALPARRYLREAVAEARRLKNVIDGEIVEPEDPFT